MICISFQVFSGSFSLFPLLVMENKIKNKKSERQGSFFLSHEGVFVRSGAEAIRVEFEVFVVLGGLRHINPCETAF